MYADDTHLTFASNDVAQLWSMLLTANKLTINKSKTEFMLIGSTQKLNTFNGLPFFNIGSNSTRKNLLEYISMKI